MSRRHTRAKKRIKKLEEMLRKAASHIDAAADVIESDMGGPEWDLDGECDAERGFAETLREYANNPRAVY